MKRPAARSAGSRPVRLALVGLAAVLVLGGGGYFAYDTFLGSPPPPAPAPKAKAAAPAATAATPPAPKSGGGPTPSETLNKIAKTPANAINKAQDVIAARRAGGQTLVDATAAGDDLADKPAAGALGGTARPAAATEKSSGMTTIAPGVTATTELEATADASVAFRSFVTAAKISSVVWGATPARAFINGRLMRAGDTADPALGITFDGVNVERRELIFKDKSGATVARRY